MLMAPILSEKDIDYLEKRFKDVFATKGEFEKYRSDVMDKLDKILSEVVASRQEQKLLARSSGDHENRIEKIEMIHPRGQHASV